MTRQIISGYLLLPHGRIGRTSYFLLSFAFLLLFGTISVFMHHENPFPIVQKVLATLNVIIYAYIHIILSIKRCHDINLSGKWALLWLVPIVNIFFWFFLLAANGTPWRNNFGDMPDRPLAEQF